MYDGKKNLRVVDEFGALTMGMMIASISAAGILYLSYRGVSRAIFFLFVPQVFLFSLGWRVLIRILFNGQNSQSDRTRRVLVVGSGNMAQGVSKRLRENITNHMVFLGFVDDIEKPQECPSWVGGTSEIQELVIDNKASDVVIALPYSDYHLLGIIVQRLEELPVNVWVALGFYDLALYTTAIEDFYDIPMIDLRASAINDYQLIVKRAFDLVFSLLGLVFAIPVLAFVSMAVIIESGRPILFRQKRAGENGRVFEMLKIRTMVQDAEKQRSRVVRVDENGNLIHKNNGDPRVTRVGHFLRRFSLDELPQLFNILKGDMSLVGPRPELPEMIEKYKPWQRKRFAIPQGLTGWWQINGRSDNPMHLHTEFDLYYIQHYSIWLDIEILIKTFWVVLRGKGAY